MCTYFIFYSNLSKTGARKRYNTIKLWKKTTEISKRVKNVKKY